MNMEYTDKKLEALRNSQVYKDWVTDDDDVVLSVSACDIPHYITEMVVVESGRGGSEPYYQVLRFFGMDGKLSVSCDRSGIRLVEAVRVVNDFVTADRL